MKSRSADSQKLESKLENLNARLAAAEAESKRVAAQRIANEKRLNELGRQLAGLKRDLADVVQKGEAAK